MCVLVCDEVVVPRISPLPRQPVDGHAACERCGRQLSKVKHHRPHGVGRACAPRCKEVKRSLDAEKAQLPAAHKPKKQRTASDPCELPAHSAAPTLTRRVNAPEPASTSKKQYNTRREEQIMRMLDETHARRMAAEEEAAAAAATGGKRGMTHTGFTLTFVP